MKLVMKKFSRHEVGRPRRLPPARKQTLRRLASAAKCPEKEADMYEKYAKEHEQSSAAPEALYDAAWRQSALIEIYKTEANQKKSEAAKSRALDLAQRIVTQYAQIPWALRAHTLVYYIQQGILTYGNASD